MQKETTMAKTKKADPIQDAIARIRLMVSTNNTWARHAILALYARQTSEEQFDSTTKETNGRGFSKFDAEILTSFAVQLKGGRFLTEKQYNIAKNKLGKYAKQLYAISLEEKGN
jgi:hypothetical protein